MEITLQGPVFDGTLDTARAYLREDFVERVILSCWEGDSVLGESGIDVVRSETPSWPGPGNVNYQIVSSAKGTAAMRSPIGAKMRTDQRLSSASLRMMHDFVQSYLPPSTASEIPRHRPKGPLFVIGAYEDGSYPFHPQDHVFWGYREDLEVLFDAPLSDATLADPSQPANVDYSVSPRANMYLGAHYHARFDPRVAAMIADQGTYLLDDAPRYGEACTLSSSYGDQIFKVFPRVELTWEKRDWDAYPFDLGSCVQECWHEAPW